MAERPPRAELAATQIGLVAARALTDGATGVVRAVFERSAYVAFGDAWVCIGPPALGAGPLNVLCEDETFSAHSRESGNPSPAQRVKLGPRLRGDERHASRSWGFRSRLPLGELIRVCDPVRVAQRTAHVGEALVVSLRAATVWRPGPPRPWTAHSLAEGMATLRKALPTAPPVEGVALLLLEPGLPELNRHARACPEHPDAEGLSLSDRHGRDKSGHDEAHGSSLSEYAPRERKKVASSPVVAAARATAAHLSRLVAAAAGGAPQRVEADRIVPLLGLGPGLTPSGDDFLGGAMVALFRLELGELCAAVWAALEPHAAERTNDISRAHLRAAAEGFGSAALHGLIEVSLAGDAKAAPAALQSIVAIGHTSGWDSLAGACVVLQAAAVAHAVRKIDSAVRT